jgi:hypothetical protein
MKRKPAFKPYGSKDGRLKRGHRMDEGKDGEHDDKAMRMMKRKMTRKRG